MDPGSRPVARARLDGLFPVGNLAPEGSVIKSTAIDPSLIDENNVYRHLGPARVFITEEAAIHAIKSGESRARRRDRPHLRRPGGRGHAGDLPNHLRAQAAAACKHVALLTDARFSGVSTGACIGHISPEALAGAPSAKCAKATRSRS